MTMSSHPRVRLLGTGLAFAAAVSVPPAALAETPVDASTPAVAAAARSPSSTAGQVVVRDANSGQLRAPTPEEAKALEPAAESQRKSVPLTLQRYHSSGARGARLTDEFMSYSVLVKQADGRLVEQCVEGREAALAATRAGVAAPTPRALPTE